MKKNIKMIIIFLTLSLGGVCLGASAAFANGTTGNKSEGEIYYTENTEVTPLLDSSHPGESIKIISSIPVQPGTPGPLSVDFAPHVVFGEHDGSQKNDIYYAKLTRIKRLADGSEEEVPNFLQLTDNRGKKSGWRLTVKQNGQLRNGAHLLKGAEITLKNIRLFSPNDGAKPIVTESVRLEPEGGEATEVSKSTETSGKGTWIIMFGKDKEESKTSIQVSVPGTIEKKKGNYTTSLTWELIDTPI
ncbi:hypothetical protein A5821_000529 [Enterococcus sp. 7F3_DIV0205]|uniref:WxL domain-containing protein n=1 Tax=Candidatus Enterococcus palustris TaxID=1834189 RepID=A0AAQ3W9Y2_9ENTE|nr:WxL domain-containing protein [Enterococcus sp. 7F3_DIV0205]OTN84942.1 hypothetical protein A5821_000871 [Enterococcus sp. 7F3_DIV0205]